jgi:hypothetical protein
LAVVAWTWTLADSLGNTLADLTTAAGRSLTFKRNTYVEAQLTLSHEDDAAAQLYTSLAASGPPTLRCYRTGRYDGPGAPMTLRFNGYLATISDELEETALLTATFRSPFGRLVGDGQGTGRFTAASDPHTAPAQDQGAIAKALIDTTNADAVTGLTTASSYATTKPRDRTYQFANVGDEITNLSQLLDGFDFDESFIDGGGSSLALFNVYGSQGSDKSGTVKFNYGPTTLANVSHVSRTISPPVNRVTVIGANGLTSTYNDATSQGQYGLWPMLQSASDVVEQATLDDKARALIRPKPLKTIQFSPELALESCPRFFDDYGLGDTVNFYGLRGAFSESVSVRVNAVTVVVDEQGFETTSIPDATDPESDRVARALLQVEVTS